MSSARQAYHASADFHSLDGKESLTQKQAENAMTDSPENVGFCSDEQAALISACKGPDQKLSRARLRAFETFLSSDRRSLKVSVATSSLVPEHDRRSEAGRNAAELFT